VAEFQLHSDDTQLLRVLHVHLLRLAPQMSCIHLVTYFMGFWLLTKFANDVLNHSKNAVSTPVTGKCRESDADHFNSTLNEWTVAS